MCLWYGDLIEIYIGIFLMETMFQTRELRNDLLDSWYHCIGDCNANKQWLEMELK